jgi:hypothetical protein
MRNKIIIGFFLVFSSLTIISNCSDPVSYSEIDNRLIGEWYLIDTLHNSYPSPNLSFFGIQFNIDNDVKLLGIETSTGRVSIWKDNYKTLISAKRGILILQYFLNGIGMTTDTSNYSFENDKLIIKSNHGNTIFKRTGLGVQIFNPLTSNLSVKVDSVIFENDKISNYPSAFIAKYSPSKLLLNATMDSSLLNVNTNITTLKIIITNFNGPGNYEILSENGIYFIYYLQFFLQYLSDSVSTGNITITEYNEINNICSGTFYFNANDGGNGSIELKDGIFTVPIYR